MSSGSKGGRDGDAKTIISPNTSFGDIIIHGGWGAYIPLYHDNVTCNQRPLAK